MSQDAFDLACHEMAPVYAERDRLREPFHQVVKFGDGEYHVMTDEDACVCVYHYPGPSGSATGTAAQAGELETALYRAREHVGGC
jgi:hypothetical protein